MSALNILHSPNDPEGLGDKLPGRTVNVSCQIASGLAWLNMHYIAALGQIGLQYNPGCFVAGMLRMRVEPPPIKGVKAPIQVVTALIYHTSKIMLTGASNAYVARSAAWMFMRLLNTRVDIPAIVYNFRIENIVCNYYLKFKVDLTAFSISEGKMMCSYVPKRFPAAIYRFGEKFAALVNRTGRIIITGSRDREKTALNYDILYEKLCRFRLPDEVTHGGKQETVLYKRPAAVTNMVEDRETSYMNMNKQVTMLFRSFDEYELQNIAADAPEFGIMQLLQDHDDHRPIPITLAPGKRHSNLPTPHSSYTRTNKSPPAKHRRTTLT